MITPVPIHKHRREQVEGEGFDDEIEPGQLQDTPHFHHFSQPSIHPLGCSPPLYLCPRRLTRSSHIGHSGMYILVLCMWHTLNRFYDFYEYQNNKIQLMDAFHVLIQGFFKLQRHDGSYKG